ncbi:hypothetical protein WA026_003281 [Henosepilachna vigintioctopunctata]|uniref:Carboxylesterase type B domain-containing protein n=1 Tax=Henosepilachna vigintioctopunctata TaxID=420089 RepID=A0AAW1TMK4_9CUCU
MGLERHRGMLRLLVVFLEIFVAVNGTPIFIKNAKISTRIVQTRYGRLQGLMVPMDQYRYLKPIEVFLGVPYATAPIQSNRFSPTKAPSPWEGVRISDKLGPSCPQKLPDISNETATLERMPKGRLEYLKRLYPYLKNQSEDCLYLNIYSPTQETLSRFGITFQGNELPPLIPKARIRVRIPREVTFPSFRESVPGLSI